MSDAEIRERTENLVLEFAIEAPPEKVRRAIESPGLRALWLPGCVPADAAPLPSSPGGEFRFILRDADRPWMETAVTFRIDPGAAGGTALTIIHEVPQARSWTRGPAAANDDPRTLMRAA